jgi:LmbE family N-acetylglucosaminyl deacetylase
MKRLRLAEPGKSLSVLCLGAHSDDIELGAGGTILGWLAAGVQLEVHWCVLSAIGARRKEAEASAAAFLAGAACAGLELAEFEDGFFPHQGALIKGFFERLKSRLTPDIVLTHKQQDAHQDHREVARLTWNTFRDHLVLEYEIPKWDGDLGQPNLYVPMSGAVIERKVELMLEHFGSQRSRDWFEAETIRSLARLRGMECRAPERYAEAFVMRKARLALGPEPAIGAESGRSLD